MESFVIRMGSHEIIAAGKIIIANFRLLFFRYYYCFFAIDGGMQRLMFYLTRPEK